MPDLTIRAGRFDIAVTLLVVLLLAFPAPALAQRQGDQDRDSGQGGQGVLGGVGTAADREAPPPKPAPRNAEGRVLLGGATPDDPGLWQPVFGIFDPIAPVDKVPFQPWSRALFEDRQDFQYEPHARCKASGLARQFLTPYGVEFVEIPEMKRVFIFDVGGPHTYRTVYMDGRTHPLNPTRNAYGHAIGWWDGDTLVVDSIGFNENFWLDRRGLPHTEQLHAVERFTRVDASTIRYEITVDDPGAYTAPWTAQFNLRRQDGAELFEYICQQSNYANELMMADEGGPSGVTSPVVP